MRSLSTFASALSIATVTLSLAWFAAAPTTAQGGADNDAQRRIRELERKIDDLREQLDDMNDRLKAREKAIEVSSSGIEIKANRIEIEASFDLDLEANTITLNKGRKPVARVGSKIDAQKGVVDGARSVLVP